MRVPFASACLIAALAASLAASGGTTPSPKPQAPSPQPTQPVFRAGIEILPIDVTAVDSNGRPVTDLAPADFTVEVDGDARQVTTAEFVRLADPFRVIGAPVKPTPPPDETFFTSNAKGAPRGRLIVILVDQGNIRTGTARAAMNSAKKFVDTLTPEDRVAVVAIPAPGELVDFTTDHDKVREALLRIVGDSSPFKLRFNLSITEALAVYQRSDSLLIDEVMKRECALAGSVAVFERCERDVEQDAGQLVGDMRHRTDQSVRGMRMLLQSLAAVEGPKSVILISEGLLFDGLATDADVLAREAADSRASLDVLLLDVPLVDVTQGVRPTTAREDRNLAVSGLEALAGASRGELYRINTTAEYAFDRISRGLDGYYLLGVEARPNDRDGRRHRISVKSTRRGVTIRSRRTFLTSVSAAATTPTDAVTRALRSPLPVNDLPLRVATWTYKEPGTGRVRILVSAEAERLTDQSLTYTAGVLLVNRDNRGIMPVVEPQTLAAKEGDAGTALYTSVIAVNPGTYRLRVALADSEGRVGSVERRVDAWQMDGPSLAVGDLIVAPFNPADQRPLVPVIEPVVGTGRMAAFAEVYGLAAAVGGVEGLLEILRDEDSPPLASLPMRVGTGTSPEIVVVQAQVSTSALPPGRYLARTTIRQGGKPQGHMVRPFRVAAAAPGASNGNAAAPPAAVGGVLPVEMAGLMLGGLPAFDRKELLSPSALTPAFAAAEKRPAASKAALKEARGGALGAAAMTALGDGDQVLAAFLRGLDLLAQSQLDRAAVQFQSAMQTDPSFAPARMYFGAALAEANRHREAAALLQSAADASMTGTPLARIAGEEWLKAGEPANAILPLEAALQHAPTDARARKLLGVGYALGNRAVDAVPVLIPYLEAQPSDQAALLAALFGTYVRHLDQPQRDTLAADRERMAKWAKAYVAAKGPMQGLVDAWVLYVRDIK